jgi:nucleotide-binding universal stress UspA family protein
LASLIQFPQPMRVERIIVGVDFSAESDTAIAHAAHLAKQRGARLYLAHVLPLPLDLVADAPYDPLLGAQAAAANPIAVPRDRGATLLQEAASRCRELGVEAEPILVDDNPSDGLARAADEVAADLLVLGTHGRTGLKRFLLGSVAERAIRLARVHALVARGPVPQQRYRRILVATDFSASADAALSGALAIAPRDSRIEIVHCWQTPMLATGAPVEPVRSELARAVVERGERLVAEQPEPPVSLTFVPLESPAAEGICRRAEEQKCDLIVTGSHGHRGVRRWLLGSVAEAVVRHAPCSVLVVRLPEDSQDSQGSDDQRGEPA